MTPDSVCKGNLVPRNEVGGGSTNEDYQEKINELFPFSIRGISQQTDVFSLGGSFDLGIPIWESVSLRDILGGSGSVIPPSYSFFKCGNPPVQSSSSFCKGSSQGIVHCKEDIDNGLGVLEKPCHLKKVARNVGKSQNSSPILLLSHPKSQALRVDMLGRGVS